MIAMAHGISVAQPSARVLINSLDAFAFRSLDQLHAASQGRSSFVVLGDVSGLTNSRNGRTHQPTGLPTVLATFEGLTFLEPWDAEDTFSCLNWALGRSRGIVYIRLHSSLVDRLTEAFPQRAISYYPVIDGGSEPNLVMVGSGLTINGCVKAALQLKSEGINARVINIVNHRSLDQGFSDLVPEGVPILAAYNGHPDVLSSIISRALVTHRKLPAALKSIGYVDGATGTLDELLQHFKLDQVGILSEARLLLADH